MKVRCLAICSSAASCVRLTSLSRGVDGEAGLYPTAGVIGDIVSLKTQIGFMPPTYHTMVLHQLTPESPPKQLLS